MFDEAARQSTGHNFFVEILIFLAVFLITAIVSSLPSVVYETAAQLNNEEMIATAMAYSAGEISMDEYTQTITQFLTSGAGLLVQLFSTGISTILTLVFCRFIEKRRISTVGFRKKGFLAEYLVGMLIGVLMFSVSVGICLVTGALEFRGVVQNMNVLMIVLCFVGFLIQGMSEEVTFRGYFMVSVSRRSHIAVAIALSSIAFGLAHIMNSSVTFFAVANITLFGVFEALYIIKRGSLWGACGIHSLWNFVQGNLYGISVSGMSKMDSVMEMAPVQSKTLMNGGDFGLEGGLAVTIVLVISIIAITLTKTNKNELFDEESAPIIEPAVIIEPR